MRSRLFLAIIFGAIIWGCSSNPDKKSIDSTQDFLEVYLVRHSEKVDQSRDPELSAAGYIRSATLAHTLSNVELEHIHSTDFIRTRKTAEPVAVTSGIEIEIYDPSDLKGFAEELILSGGRHLVVGHSNTTPRMVELLGGESGPEINEANEYDRLYIVTIGLDGRVSTMLLRYGISYIPEF